MNRRNKWKEETNVNGTSKTTSKTGFCLLIRVIFNLDQPECGPVDLELNKLTHGTSFQYPERTLEFVQDQNQTNRRRFGAGETTKEFKTKTIPYLQMIDSSFKKAGQHPKIQSKICQNENPAQLL